MKTFEEFRFSIPHNKVRGYKYSPKNKKELIEAIEAEIKLQGLKANLNCINTSDITDMSELFDPTVYLYTKKFNGDISKWDVSNVVNMYHMFEFAAFFNGDISNWDVSNVTNMGHMFGYAESFNQDISNWDVSKVKDMHGMFYSAKNFNGDISNWDVSNVEDMRIMFKLAKSFDQDISGWDVSNVKNTFFTFDNCPIKEEYKPKFK